MDNQIIQIKSTSLESITPLIQQTTEYIEQAKTKATERAYKADWKDFETWCAKYSRSSLPADPETIAMYISDLSNRLAISTIQRRLVTISQAHQTKGYPSPTTSALVRNVWQGIRRVRGTAQDQKQPLLVDHIRSIVKLMPDTLSGARDRAILILGISGAFRRSELVSLNVHDLSFVDHGLVVLLARSKTDQEGQGTEIGIPSGSRAITCPVRTMKRWLDVSGITNGPLFRGIDRHNNLSSRRLTSQSIALIVKKWAEEIGINPATIGGHSLRSGFATECAQNNVPIYGIKEQGRWKTETMVSRYIRKGSLFNNNAAEYIGL